MQRDVNEFRAVGTYTNASSCIISIWVTTDVTGNIYNGEKKRERGRENKKKEREDIIEIHNAVDVGELQVRWRMRVEEKGGEVIRVD